MAISQTLTAPTTAPSRTQDKDTFNTNVDNRLAWEATHVTELTAWTEQANATEAALSSIAAGGAMAIPYTFSTTTADADPGAGALRLNQATQNTATVIRADLVGSDGVTWTSVLDTFDDATSTVKGYIMLQKVGDGTKWIIFSVSSLASPSGYKNITVAVVASSSASPFANGDAVVLKFTRNGDKGDVGTGGLTLLATATASNSAAIDFTGLSSTYSAYEIYFSNVIPTALVDDLLLRTSTNNGSSFDSAASDYAYTWVKVEGGTVAGITQTPGHIQICASVGGDVGEHGVSGKITIFNPSANLPTFVQFTAGGVTGTPAQIHMTGTGRRAAAQVVNAVRLSMFSGNISQGTFKLYGVSAA